MNEDFMLSEECLQKILIKSTELYVNDVLKVTKRKLCSKCIFKKNNCYPCPTSNIYESSIISDRIAEKAILN
jgi:hypothetical protein